MAEDEIYTGHIVEQGMFEQAKRLMEYNPAIIPLRHPHLMMESWKRRGKPVKDMVTAYRRILELDSFDPYYLPMDVEDRAEYLNKIEDGLNISLGTDWPIVNSKEHTSDLNWKEIVPDEETSQLVNEIIPFLNRFYR